MSETTQADRVLLIEALREQADQQDPGLLGRGGL
jgi:hypothetical protein